MQQTDKMETISFDHSLTAISQYLLVIANIMYWTTHTQATLT